MIPILPATAAALGAPLILGATGTAFFGRRTSGTVPGLLFHSLDLKSGFSLSALTTVRFRKIIERLAGDGYYALTLNQSTENRVTGDRRHPIHLTFDDGCGSFFTLAAPILEQFHFKATVFPVAGYLGRTSSWDVLPQFPHLSNHEVRAISDQGHEIGSHGLTHSNLTFLGPADLKTELADSKKILEDITGRKVTSLSFPFGSWNRRVWDCARETGYLRGTIYRQHRKEAPGLVPVFGVYRYDSPEFILARIAPSSWYSVSVACARIMSHFAKGAPLWKFEKKYRLFPAAETASHLRS
jgi:peptidoglycan/xylan/chitin deacetylase (PgdA/CDA1 family)